jgi:UDP-N-acetylmuramate dehydrogenase
MLNTATNGRIVSWRPRRRVLGDVPYLPSSTVRRNEPLALHTTLGVGGRADYFVVAGSPADLRRVILFAVERECPLFFLGAGSNVAFSDEGFRGVVVRLGGAFSYIGVEENTIEAGGAAPVQRVLREAYMHGLSGFEFASGIPGSVGGGLRMNAGTIGGSIGSVTKRIRVLDKFGEEHTIDAADAGFRYRGSDLDGYAIVGAEFELKPEGASAIQRRVAALESRRKSSQPDYGRCAGCVFKNPPNAAAGKLLDDLGFKGRKVGGAFVSDRHANFIINDGTATRQDIDRLIEVMRAEVRERYGVELETEVLRMGPYGPEGRAA